MALSNQQNQSDLIKHLVNQAPTTAMASSVCATFASVVGFAIAGIVGATIGGALGGAAGAYMGSVKDSKATKDIA